MNKIRFQLECRGLKMKPSGPVFHQSRSGLQSSLIKSLLLTAGILLCFNSLTWAEPEGWLLESYRKRVREHRLFDLEPGSTHADSLEAIGYERWLTSPHSPRFDKACIAIVEILDVFPPDSTSIESFPRWGKHQKRHLRTIGSLVSIRVLEVLGCRGLQLGGENLFVHTLCPTTNAIWDIGGFSPPQILYTGVQAYVRIAEAGYYKEALILTPLLLLGEPGHESSVFGLQEQIRPLFEEFARDLEAVEPEEGR